MKPVPARELRRRERIARRERPAGAMLPYARQIDESTIVGRDGQQTQILHLAGFAFETADTQELNYRKNVRDTLLRGVASPRLTLGAYVIRHQVRPELMGAFDGAFARHVDEAWRERLAGRRLFVNDLFVTLTRRPAVSRPRPCRGPRSTRARRRPRFAAGGARALWGPTPRAL
jgi:type IV secretion system protein VirB4